jgi:hypothetical protein
MYIMANAALHALDATSSIPKICIPKKLLLSHLNRSEACE